MGCASTCIGYELTADIDLDTDGDGNIGSDTDDAYNNAGAGWDPIGDFNNRYTGVLHGNGFAITNLYISRATESYMGLFSLVGIGARVEALNITAANITGNNYVGVLASYNIGEVIAVHTAGSVTANSGSYAGGIVANQTAAVIYPFKPLQRIRYRTGERGRTGRLRIRRNKRRHNKLLLHRRG